MSTMIAPSTIPFRYALSNFTDKNVMLNWVDSGAMENLFEIRRVEITTNLSPADKNQVFTSTWENNSPSSQPYYNQFDFPKINPDYEGRFSDMSLIQQVILSWEWRKIRVIWVRVV